MIQYDRWGRIRYNPKIHKKRGKPWSRKDLQYLIDWYEKIGSEELSFALERPETSILQKVDALRRKGIMKKASKPQHIKTIKKELSPKSPKIKISKDIIA